MKSTEVVTVYSAAGTDWAAIIIASVTTTKNATALLYFLMFFSFRFEVFTIPNQYNLNLFPLNINTWLTLAHCYIYKFSCLMLTYPYSDSAKKHVSCSAARGRA